MIAPSRRLSRVRRQFDAYEDRRGVVRLDRNEDPVGWAAPHFEACLAAVTPHDLAAYADAAPLVARLSRWLGVDPDWILVTAGSDAVARMVFETYVDPGDVVLVPDPSWRMYDVYADIQQATLVRVPYDADLHLDGAALQNHLRTTPTRLLVVANPDQPTGTLMQPEALEALVAEAGRRDTVCLIDEAYHLFTPDTVVSVIDRHPHLLVARTFSKAFGLAGLRIGYCVAHPDRLRELSLVRPVTDANSLALHFASYALDHLEWIRARVADVIAGRDVLRAAMRDAGIAVPASHTNFLLIPCRDLETARTAIGHLRDRGYRLKGPFTFAPLAGYIRVSVGPVDLMRRFWADCADLLIACAGRPA